MAASNSKTATLALFPATPMGHLIPAVELAKRLAAGNPTLAVTLLLINQPNSGDATRRSYLRSLRSDAAIARQGIAFADLPPLDGFDSNSGDSQAAFTRAVDELRAAGRPPLAGVVVDLFHSAIVDVIAAEIGDLPCYVYFTGGAAALSMMFHLREMGVDLAAEYERRPDGAVQFPVFEEAMPMKALPEIALNKATSGGFLRHAERFRRAKGILVNSFTELEEGFIRYMDKKDDIPTIYSVGPIVNVSPPENHAGGGDSILGWLDEQPPASVVFLCFGSMGSFEERQLREIAVGLERSGRRFLWSIRRRLDGSEAPSDYDDVGSVLPEGFLERTAERGKVIGWAPQTAVLGHVAVGAFVSHCGWNSTLESLWFGVPMAAWPLYAEQQFNARLLVRGMGLAAAVRLDYRQGEKTVVEAAEVEEGIRRVVDEADEAAAKIRRRAREMSAQARKALEKGGSSYDSMGRFVEDLYRNLDSRCSTK